MTPFKRIALCTSTTLLLTLTAPASQAEVIVWEQGFETDTAGWFDQNSGWTGSTARVASGTGGITSSGGAFHALFTQTNTPGVGLSGPFTRFDGYRSTWPGGWTASIDIYLDTSWAAGEGFDYSVAANGTDGNHQRDFIFHVTQDTSSGQLLVGGSNNTNFDPIENLETGNHFVVANSGWYTFQHHFYDFGGQLAVDLNLLDAGGTLLFTETRTDASDIIPTEVGGNRYGWFTNIDVANGIAVDNHTLALVPEPASLALLAGAIGLIGGARRRRS